MLKKTLLMFYVLLPSLLVFSQKKIVGDTLPLSGNVNTYSINVTAEQVVWQIPEFYGKIIEGQGTNKIHVQWLTPYQNTVAFVVKAFITFPNSVFRDTWAQQRMVLKKQTGKNQNNLNKRFSKTSKDGLRYFFQLHCDTLVDVRQVVLTDSSLARSKTENRAWTIQNQAGKTVLQSEEKQIALNLAPGKYTATLLHQTANSIISLSDTFTIYKGLRPAFTVSEKTACEGTPLVFSNTSPDEQLTLSSTFSFGDGAILEIFAPQKTVWYVYEYSSFAFFNTFLTAGDLYNCTYTSTANFFTTRQNMFSAFGVYGTNSGIMPQQAHLAHKGDSVVLSVQNANPNTPITYVWNTGDTAAALTVKQAGRYSTVLTDAIGCKSEPQYAVVLGNADEAPKIKGQSKVKQGTKLQYKMSRCNNCLYQWHFMYDVGHYYTEPVKEPSITPAWGQSLKAGKQLKVVGIHYFPAEKRSVYSDTLNVVVE
ncbi:MAG: hypothetical protein KF900_10050 [Bacteroidetes bacterium]|nr:hypothetical protein [Bacteroidota bacterium]